MKPPKIIVISLYLILIVPEKGGMIRKLLEFQNAARTKPASVVKYLKALLEKEANKTTPYAKALKEGIEFVEKLKPVGLLKYSALLSEACKIHSADLAKYAVVEHTGSDGSKLEDRLKKVGNAKGEVGESLLSGKDQAEECIVSMILDGTPQKEQRKNLFNPELKLCGISTEVHHKLKTIIVINYATEFTKA